MTLFVENPVAASSLARWMNRSMRPQTFDGSVVFLRHPLERFWSAVKKSHGHENIEAGVDAVLAELDTTSFSHYLPQAENVRGQRITRVIKMDEAFTDNIMEVTQANNVQWIEGFDLANTLAVPVNTTPSDNDDAALAYLKATQRVFDKLQSFYAEDFSAWSNPEELL